MASKKQNYVTRTVQAVNQITAAVQAAELLVAEGQTLGYVANGATPGSLVDADFLGNGQLNAASFAGLMATLQALDASLHANSNAIFGALLAAKP